MTDIDPKEFYQLQAQVNALVKSDAEKTQLLSEVHAGMCAIQVAFAEVRGGWKIVVAIGTAAATLGAGILELISHFHHWLGGAP